MAAKTRLLICMTGLPRSGKSTVAYVLACVRNAPIVNRDSIRLALYGERFLKPAELMVRVIAKVMVEALFRVGHTTVIVDETNMKRSTRDYWREGDWTTQFLAVRTSFSECIRRANVTKDEAIRPVIMRMNDYAEALAEDEVEYVVMDATVCFERSQSESEGLKMDVTG